MTEWLAAFSLLAFGILLTFNGIRSIRLRLHENGIPAIEQAILRLTDSEPLPRSRLDRVLGALNHWLSVLFGLMFLLVGAVIVAGKLEWL